MVNSATDIIIPTEKDIYFGKENPPPLLWQIIQSVFHTKTQECTGLHLFHEYVQ